VKVVPIPNGQSTRKLSVVIHEVKLVPRQNHGQNQLHLQLARLHPGTRVPTGPPPKVRIRNVRNRVRSQPPSWIVFVRFGVVFGVQVCVSDAIREEISPFDHLFADFEFLTNVPSESDAGEGDSLRFPRAGFDDWQFVFPSGEGDRSELLERRRGGGVAGVSGNKVLNLLLALLSPLWVGDEVDQCPTRLFGWC